MFLRYEVLGIVFVVSNILKDQHQISLLDLATKLSLDDSEVLAIVTEMLRDGRLKGILVVSGSHELDPKRRATQFSESVLRGCTDQGYCILSSYHLFKLVQDALASKQGDHSSIRRQLIECDGEFRGAETK